MCSDDPQIPDLTGDATEPMRSQGQPATETNSGQA
jgi:hypothetical protein